MKLLGKILLILLGFILLAGVFNAMAGNSIDDYLNNYETRKEIKVAPGDTLWSIAQKLPESDTENMNMLVSAIKTLNNLESSSLKVGQTITIPVKEVN